MFLFNNSVFVPYHFNTEADLENSILEIQNKLFGNNRIYLNIKKLIGEKGKKQNIPDGYLIDLSNKNPKLYVVEVELAIHHPLNHIAVQLLEFSLSFENSKQKVKNILKDALKTNLNALNICNEYVSKYNYENLDYLLERIIYKDKDAFNALVIIDELDDYLERVLYDKFKFPIEVISIERFINQNNEIAYNFEPFLQEIEININSAQLISTSDIDYDIIDTVVVPAQKKGFDETFLDENQWYAIRIHSSMIDKIKYIAAYQVAPISAITHIAEVKEIKQWQDSGKYIVIFKDNAKEIQPKLLVKNGIVKAPQSIRYANYNKIISAANLDEVF